MGREASDGDVPMSGSGALLGLLLGVGLLLIWRSGARAPQAPTGSRRVSRRQQALSGAGLTGINAAQLLALQVGLGLVATLVVLLTTSTVTVSLVFGMFGFALPYMQVRRLAGRRQADLREVWPEVVDNLASAVRAGMSLPEALSTLSTRGPEVLRPPFARFAAEYRSTGRFNTCLDRLKDDLADPVGDRIVETLRVAREVGGSDLGRVLRTLATFLREDARARAELETRQGWVVSAARLAVAAPWAVLLLLATQSTTLAAYDSAVGTAILVGGGVVCVVAYRLMLHIGRLPQDVRVLQ
jgi:tight adherence protein B